MTPAQESTFVEFPDKENILARLRSIDIYEPIFDPLFELMSERLAHKAYDRSAFVFILIELIYEFEEPTDRYFNELLSGAVAALTEDADLVKAALDAFQEIKVTLEPAGGEAEAVLPEPAQPVQAELREPSVDDTVEIKVPVDIEGGEIEGEEPIDGEPVPHRIEPAETDGVLMDGLQEAQKQIQDLGLSTRVLIGMTLGRPDGANVSRTWREISTLRSALRRFDELLSRSEERILEAGGVLEEES